MKSIVFILLICGCQLNIAPPKQELNRDEPPPLSSYNMRDLTQKEEAELIVDAESRFEHKLGGPYEIVGIPHLYKMAMVRDIWGRDHLDGTKCMVGQIAFTNAFGVSVKQYFRATFTISILDGNICHWRLEYLERENYKFF